MSTVKLNKLKKIFKPGKKMVKIRKSESVMRQNPSIIIDPYQNKTIKLKAKKIKHMNTFQTLETVLLHCLTFNQ